MRHTVYILHSKNLNRYYIGATSDFDTRLKFHYNAPPNKFTSNADDWLLFLMFECDGKRQALKIERHIKKMKSNVYIQNLLKYPDIIEKLKEKYSN